MYDTVNAVFYRQQASNINIWECKKALIASKENFSEGMLVSITGLLPNPNNESGHCLKVKITANCVRIGLASLCKWYYGNAFRTFEIDDVRDAIELLAYLLDLPMQDAYITRLDIGFNVELEHPTSCYIEYLGEMPYKERLPYLRHGGLYYKTEAQQVVLYDKIKEQKAKRKMKGLNMLRMELRYTKRVGAAFKRKNITLGMLYEKEFFQECLIRLAATYKSIDKLNDFVIDFSQIKGKRDFNNFAKAYLVYNEGGKLSLKQKISSARNSEEVTKKRRYDLNQAIDNALEVSSFYKPNNFTQELNSKVAETIRSLYPK